MGIKATVVYDVRKHSAIVVRTQTVSMTERYEVIDTVASFSQHCESLRGVARSATEVSAAWGGPPYVSYTVVDSRFRVIVIWDQRAAEFDLAHDVEECLLRLEGAVASVSQPLIGRRSDAVAKVYEEAGYALRGDMPIILPDPVPEGTKQASRSRLQSKTTSGVRRSSVAEPKKKKAGGGGLFGRIGSALKHVTGGGAEEEQGSIVNTRRPLSSLGSTSSLRAPSESAANSVAMYGTEGDSPFDEEIGQLELSEEVFAWANFGGELPKGGGDLSWFAQLIHNEEGLRKRPRPPLLRAGNSPSTPLTIPSVASPISHGNASADSSVIYTGQPLALPAIPEAPQGTAVSLPSPPSRAPSSMSIAAKPPLPAASAVSTPVEARPQQTAARPQQTAARPQQTAAPKQTVSVKQGQSPSTLQQPSVPPQMVPTALQQAPTIPQQAARRAGVPHASMPMRGTAPGVSGTPVTSPAMHQSPMPGMALPAAMPYPAHLTSPPTMPAPNFTSAPVSGTRPAVVASGSSSRTSGPSMQTVATGYVTPQAGSGSASNIPHALAEQMKNTEEFDLAALGGYKDDAAVTTRSQSTTSGMGSSGTRAGGDDDPIRSRMNEFAVTMQAGNFTLALQQVFGTLKLLRTIQPRRDRETITCANYVLAQKVLIRNAVLENELTRVPPGTAEAVRRHIESALLTMFLAELKHLLPRHRVAAMKVAVSKNLIVGNYGMCARWLRLLVEKAPPAQKGEFSQQLEICVRNGERNAQMPPTNRLCYNTLQVLTSPYGVCNVCGAVYHPQMAGVMAGQICPTCFVGAVEGKM